nr:CpaF family protein [Salsipaludibacter albus]
MGPALYDPSTSTLELERQVRSKLGEVIAADSTPLSQTDRQKLIETTIDDILGYGPIEPLLNDRTVTEVMCNGPDAVYIEREGKLVLTDTKFLDDGHLRRTIEKIVGEVGRRIDESSPYVDARLPDGSRVNAVIPPVSLDGPMLTIRKFSPEAYGGQDLVNFGTWSPKAANFLAACVSGKTNLLVSGGTGAGKTTTLNVLSSYIPLEERIVTIEDAAELQLGQPHVVRMEYRPPNIEGRGEVTIRDLVRNSLRMRPDRIVVGEVRGGEALDMLQAMNTGHDGSISTIHANSPRDALSRLETMVLMAGVDLPVRAIREQIAAGVQFIAHQSRFRDGSRKITRVSEITGMEGDVITMQDIFEFDWKAGTDEATGKARGKLEPTGIRPSITDHLRDLGVQVSVSWFAPDDEMAVR